ncbi:auxilin-related protein 2 [Phtheirospermum japonicum]|uniref:Auxilin-related protein 2 n=1 Tax=Phtheirospermum japonicum TaxID=374723 RepID=A0A830CY67_9LAMI|nr:auxilin-related protein 2 [Phtheirospermum japonicum]
MEKKFPTDNFQEPPLFDMPNVSTGFQKSFGQNASTSPQYFETSPRVDMSPTSSGHHFDDAWLTVSEIPLFTQPTAAPPPSRPPPPTPRQTSRSESGYFSSSSRKKGDGFSSPSDYSQHSDSPNLARPAAKDRPVSQFDDLGDFAAGRSHYSIDERANLYSGEETNAFSAASASAAAMKEAMDKAEAKFRHAREVRERENAKAARNKDDQDEESEQKRLQRESEREKARQAVERASREARERAAAEARLKNERAAVDRANSEARERAGRVAVQRAAEKSAAAGAREKELRDKDAKAKAEDARRRAERVAVERAAAEARERAATAAVKMNQQRNDDDLESFFGVGRSSSAAKQANSSNPFFDQQFRNKGVSEAAKRTSSSSGASSNVKRSTSTNNIADDLSSVFGAAQSSVEFQEVEGETEERRRARLDRHQRTQERTVKALAEKNQRDLQAQMEQEERHRIGGTLDIEIKRWAAGKEGNLRALLSTLQYVLWPECGWQPVSLTDLIIGASVKKAYRKATLCIHPDKVQQKGATLQQKYIAEKVFDLLKEAWNKFNSEELF